MSLVDSIGAAAGAGILPTAGGGAAGVRGGEPLRETFQDFVAGTFYGQMIKSLRSGVGKPAYMHGGQAEEMFQGQMDQIVAEDLARKHGSTIAEPLFRTFEQQMTARRVLKAGAG